MFEFTIRENALLNEFKNMFADYVNKAYKFTMSYISNPVLADFRDNERLILIVINKSVFQNLYSFIKLNESNMQFAAFSCLEGAVNSMRLYQVLSLNPDYMHDYITNTDFSLDKCELELLEKQEKYENNEEFSLREFAKGLHKMNTFEFKNSSISLSMHARISPPSTQHLDHSTTFSMAISRFQCGFQPNVVFSFEQSSFRKFAS